LFERAHMVTCNPSETPVDTESKLGLEGAPGTLDLGLHLYASSITSLVGYTDADWVGCSSTRGSTSCYCVFLGNNLLSWSAKRQHTLSRSSAKDGYRGVANVVAETARLYNLLCELHSPLSTETIVYCDNISAAYMLEFYTYPLVSNMPIFSPRDCLPHCLKNFDRDYALESATRILNMVPTKKVDKTLYELWYGKIPNLSYLKVYGCEALVKRDTPEKLQQKAVKYAEFFEKNLITQEVGGRAVDLEEIQDEDTSPSEITIKIPMVVEGFEPPQEEVISIHRSERTHRAPYRLCLNVEVEEHSLGDLNEPASYKAAMLDSESNKWIDAMNAEIQSMIDNTVWVLVDLPPGCKTVGSKWIFKKNTDMDGIVHTSKARLVANGYTQLYRVDYKETFSPVTDIRAIRILISIAAFYDYEIWQMDVKIAFLNGYLDEDIYMVQPEGFVDPNHPRKVCKLQRSIYGLKQSSRSGNKRFDEKIKRFGFAQNLDEPCVYQKASGSNITFLILYVDDIIIMGNHIPSLQSVKDYIGKCFAMKDLGEAAFILGIKIYRDRTQCASTPKKVRHMQNVPYASAVGSIMSAYLRNTKDMFLVYGGNPKAELQVDCYYDAGFETDRNDTKSQTGYVFILNEGAVDWKSSKQSTTAMSATEAEYIAASEAAMEAVWIRKFISGLGIVPTINEPIRIFCDNSAALHFANEPGVQRGARHYHRRYHYVRESIALGKIRFLKVHTDDNLADPFAKALSNTKLTQHSRSMGLRLASSFM
nr:hypothetical protein [Tanacetum cinerariifolium]